MLRPRGLEDHEVRLTATGWTHEALHLCRLSPQRRTPPPGHERVATTAACQSAYP